MSVRNILDGTIKIEGGGGGGEIPEDLKLKSLTVDKIRCGGEISATNVLARSKIEADDVRTRGLLVREPYFTLVELKYSCKKLTQNKIRIRGQHLLMGG